MIIRKYLPSDELRIREILVSNIPAYFAMDDMKMLNNWLKAQNEGIPAYPPSVADYFYLLETDKVIGCAGFYVLETEKRAQLTWGMLDSEYHNKGYGKLLFESRVNKINELYPGFQITLWTSQITYKYFEKFGMKVSRITTNGFGNNFDKYEMYMGV